MLDIGTNKQSVVSCNLGTILLWSDTMSEYEVGAIFTRCFLQKRFDISPTVFVEPLFPTGSRGEIYNARALLERAGHSVTRDFVERASANFKDTGASVCIHFLKVDAPSALAAMHQVERAADTIAGALAVLSVNPVIPLVMFARCPGDAGGVDFKFPNDPIIRHGTNVHGYLDAIPDLCALAGSNAKVALLLSLYRASLREPDVDKKMLFQLVLLEEISDDNTGSLKERLDAFCKRYDVAGDFDAIAAEIGFVPPARHTVIEALVKLRNAVAHNGEISEESIKPKDREWMAPLIADKAKLHLLVGDAIRYVFAVLAGHSRDKTATKIELKPGETFQVKFD
jgi:hypothetical protein